MCQYRLLYRDTNRFSHPSNCYCLPWVYGLHLFIFAIERFFVPCSATIPIPCFLVCVQNGEVTGGVIELESPAVGVVKAGKNIVVGTMDKCFHSYHVKVRFRGARLLCN